MSMKKTLSALLAVCLVFGCLSITAWAKEPEGIAVGENKTFTVPVGDDQDEYISYSFTPKESGSYFFAVEFEGKGNNSCGAWFYVDSGDAYFSYGEPLCFQAEADRTYELTVNYYGDFSSEMKYVVSVTKAQPLVGIELSAEDKTGYVGDYLYIDVTYKPAMGEREEITWTVSDPAVVEVVESYADYAELYLLGVGTAIVTATTAGGKTASIEITVEDAPDPSTFVVGTNKVTLSKGEGVSFTFTPEQTGYYTLTVDNSSADYGLFADFVSDGDEDYFDLEAGETYEGEVYSWVDEDIEVNLIIKYHSNKVFVEPVAIEIIKLPSQLTYLKDSVEYVWSDDRLSGLELEVTWADGTVSDWNYDEKGGKIGTGWIGGSLNVKDDGTYEVEVYASCGEDVAPVYFALKVLDITAEKIELLDHTPLQVVENSCGIAMEQYDAWFYLPMMAYDRQVKVTFSDDSTVTAKPGEEIYGVSVSCYNNQGVIIMGDQNRATGIWSKDGENLIIYQYEDLTVTLPVEIIDSPVQSLEVVTPPVNNAFMMDKDQNLITAEGKMVESIRDLLEGICLKVGYKDGTFKTFKWEDIQWIDAMGTEYPVLDGYPIGILGGWLLEMEAPVAPAEVEGYVEYKGVSAGYPIKIVKTFETEDDNDQPDIEPIPGTGDADLFLSMALLTCLTGTAVVVTRKKED